MERTWWVRGTHEYRSFATWREAIDYADDRARYEQVERQWLVGMTHSRLTERGVRREGWRS